MSGYGGGAGLSLLGSFPAAAGDTGTVNPTGTGVIGTYSAWLTVLTTTVVCKGIVAAFSPDGFQVDDLLSVKLALGAAGLEVVFLGPYKFRLAAQASSSAIAFPFTIPAGSRISVAIANLTTANVLTCQVSINTLA